MHASSKFQLVLDPSESFLNRPPNRFLQLGLSALAQHLPSFQYPYDLILIQLPIPVQVQQLHQRLNLSV